MTPLRRSALLRIVLLLVALPLFVLGCDTAEDMMFQDDTVFVNADIEVFFRFDADDFDASGVATVTGDRSFLIDGLLDGSGFDRMDVVSISGLAGSGELLIDSPPLAVIDEINQAELSLGGIVAATAQVTMMDDDEDLTVTTNSLNALRNNPGFDTALRVVLSDPAAAQDYTLEARLTLRFEVQP
ncbi:MAG: hypothetical protein AAGF99_18255 [Bacteroidota bacterium]